VLNAVVRQSLPQRLVREKAFHGRGEVARIGVEIHQEPAFGVLHDVHGAAILRPDERESGCRGLQEGQAEVLHVRGAHEDPLPDAARRYSSGTSVSEECCLGAAILPYRS